MSTFAFLPPANEVWGKVIFSETCVKNSVHGGWGTTVGGGLPQCMLGYHLPPEPGTPPGTPPPAEHAGRYGQRAGGTHPTGMQYCFPIVFIIVQNPNVDIEGLRLCFSKKNRSNK